MPTENLLEQPSVDLLSRSSLIASEKSESAIAEFSRSLAYSALQSPLKALAQVIDKPLGYKLEEKVSFINPASPAKFNSTRFWIQQTGSAVGALATFFVASKFAKSIIRSGMCEAQLTQQISRQGALGLTLKEAALCGFVHDALLHPTDSQDKRGLLAARLTSGASGAFAMTVLTASTLGLKSLGEVTKLEQAALAERSPLLAAIPNAWRQNVISPLLRSDIFTGITAGIFAGATGTNIESLLRQGKPASLADTVEGAQTMATLAGFFSTWQHFSAKAQPEMMPIADISAKRTAAAQGAEIEPEKLPGRIEEVTASRPYEQQSNARLKPDERLTLGFFKGAPQNGPFTDYADFLARGQTFGNVSLEGYYHPNRASTIYNPELAANYNRPSPATLTTELAKLPDSTLIAELVIVDHVHPLEPWLKQTTGGTIAAETGELGRVTLFRPTPEILPKTLSHEWGHLLLKQYPELAKLWEISTGLEPLRSPSDSLVYNNGQEPWAILSETFLTSPLATSFELALQNPIKTAIFAKTLKHHLSTLSPSFQSPLHANYLEPANLLDCSGTQFGIKSLKQSNSAGSSELLRWLENPESNIE